jgi:hypothetical protein
MRAAAAAAASASVTPTTNASVSLTNSNHFNFTSHRKIYTSLPISTVKNSHKKSTLVVVRAIKDRKETETETENMKEYNKESTTKQQQPLNLEDVNPVGLGRKSRQIFDEVWRKFSGLGQISRTTRADDKEALDALLIREGPMCEFAIPGAQNTTVLVVGATSRIGRIVVRKLMLRGYTVKVFFLLSFFNSLIIITFGFNIPDSLILGV